MARTTLQAQATTLDAMVTAINALLAPLTNPTIRGLKLSVQNPQRQVGRKYSALLTYDTGGAALATDFVVSLIEAKTMAALETAIAAFYVANSSAFKASPFLYVIDDTVHTPLYGAMILYNPTAGASANFATLNP